MSVFSNDCSHGIDILFHDRGGRLSRTAQLFTRLMSFEKGFVPSLNHPLSQTFILEGTLHLPNQLNCCLSEANTIPNHTTLFHFDIHIRTKYSIWRMKVDNIFSCCGCSATSEWISLIFFCSL